MQEYRDLSDLLIVTQLKHRREQLGLSQQDVDDILDMSSGLVGKWECGDRVPHAGSISRWADALNCKLVVVRNGTSGQTER